mmetsp:Transcript_6737/g.8409  ORF Transcript_6737/g.8409 Transcript_6737/m.8409 type:complete len:1212 (+) Transcript_6737:285-3920(+)
MPQQIDDQSHSVSQIEDANASSEEKHSNLSLAFVSKFKIRLSRIRAHHASIAPINDAETNPRRGSDPCQVMEELFIHDNGDKQSAVEKVESTREKNSPHRQLSESELTGSGVVPSASNAGSGTNSPPLGKQNTEIKKKQKKKFSVLGLVRRRDNYKNMDGTSNGLSFRVRQSYCMPTFSTLPVVTLLAVYITDFYEQLGAQLSKMSFYIALARSLDVTSDPLMSYLTDSYRSRFGRRRPFCITGCWFYALFLMALLSPPNQSVSRMGDYFGIFYMLFFVANTFTTIPYDALGPELTDNYEDRSKLFFVSGLYDGFGALVAITFPQFIAYAYVFVYEGCEDSSCYNENGTGLDCLPNINTGDYQEYDLGFGLFGNQSSFGSWNYSSELCTSGDLWSGLESYCLCLDNCSSMCTVESQRVAFQWVGFFFGSWFCLTMLNMILNVKERSQRKVKTEPSESQDHVRTKTFNEGQSGLEHSNLQEISSAHLQTTPTQSLVQPVPQGFGARNFIQNENHSELEEDALQESPSAQQRSKQPSMTQSDCESPRNLSRDFFQLNNLYAPPALPPRKYLKPLVTRSSSSGPETSLNQFHSKSRSRSLSEASADAQRLFHQQGLYAPPAIPCGTCLPNGGHLQWKERMPVAKKRSALVEPNQGDSFYQNGLYAPPWIPEDNSKLNVDMKRRNGAALKAVDSKEIDNRNQIQNEMPRRDKMEEISDQHEQKLTSQKVDSPVTARPSDESLQERQSPRNDPASIDITPALVPSILNTFRNKPFVLLLPAWICDSVGFAIIASMTAYFVRYVIKPEYQTLEENGIDCNEGIPIEGTDSASWMCDSTYVLGATVTTLLICAFLGTPFWLWAAKKYGKRMSWLMWSFTMSITNILFLAVGEGDVVPCLVLGGINGFPFGAKFLADAILSDIIDYDEFLTGQRNEATYTMFKSFLPKICAIPAAAIPLAVMESLGHVAPVNGQISEQPAIISTYCYFVSVIIPTTLSVVSFLLKYRFPLKTKEMVDDISVGIGLHLYNKPAVDPISKIELKLMPNLTKEELDVINLLDYFPDSSWLERVSQKATTDQSSTSKEAIIQDSQAEIQELVKREIRSIAVSILSLAGAFVGVCYTFHWLDNAMLSVVPVVLVIVFGSSVTCTLFFTLRLLAALNLKKRIPRIPPDLIRRILDQRKCLDKIGQKAGEQSNLFNDIKSYLAKSGNSRKIVHSPT